MNIKDLTQVELAALVQEALRNEGIDAVLTGGAAVALYSKGAYVSADIDLADTGFASFQKITTCMQALGFSRPGKHFVHPETPYFVEFVLGRYQLGKKRSKTLKRSG